MSGFVGVYTYCLIHEDPPSHGASRVTPCNTCIPIGTSRLRHVTVQKWRRGLDTRGKNAPNYKGNIGIRLEHMDSNFSSDMAKFQSLAYTIGDIESRLRHIEGNEKLYDHPVLCAGKQGLKST